MNKHTCSLTPLTPAAKTNAQTVLKTALKQLRQVLSNTETVLGGCAGNTCLGPVNLDKYLGQYLQQDWGNQYWYRTGDSYWGSTGTALKAVLGKYWGSNGGSTGEQHWGSTGTLLKQKSLAHAQQVLSNMPSSPSKANIRYSLAGITPLRQ